MNYISNWVDIGSTMLPRRRIFRQGAEYLDNEINSTNVTSNDMR